MFRKVKYFFPGISIELFEPLYFALYITNVYKSVNHRFPGNYLRCEVRDSGLLSKTLKTYVVFFVIKSSSFNIFQANVITELR